MHGRRRAHAQDAALAGKRRGSAAEVSHGSPGVVAPRRQVLAGRAAGVGPLRGRRARAGWKTNGPAGPCRSGPVVLVPLDPCVRCTTVTRAQPGLEADVDVFRTLARHHRGLFGVWCDVLTGGTLSVGEEAIVAARRPAEGGTHR